MFRWLSRRLKRTPAPPRPLPCPLRPGDQHLRPEVRPAEAPTPRPTVTPIDPADRYDTHA